MNVDEGLYQFVLHNLGAEEKYRDEIPPFEEIKHVDLILAAMVVFHRKKFSPEEAIYGMERLGVSADEIEAAFIRVVRHFSRLN